MSVIHELVERLRREMETELDAMVAQPIRVFDDGNTRIVEMLRGVKYGYSRRERIFHARLKCEDGAWQYLPASSQGTVTFDTYLPMRNWRNRACFALRHRARRLLQPAARRATRHLSNKHAWALRYMCDDLVEQAWQGLHMRQRLRALFKTKAMRHTLRTALGVDESLVSLARASRFRANRNSICQRWLSFVWQNRGTLERIHAQTPALLRSVAAHMFQHGIADGTDPTRECMKWLIGRGIGKRTYRLLTRQSERPFREVIRRWQPNASLDALVLAMNLAEGGHDAESPRPAFYRAALDQFERNTSASTVSKYFGKTPPRVFAEARKRFRAMHEPDGLKRIGLEFRAILDWWESHEDTQFEQAGWQRWLALAQEADARKKVAMQATTWPCAVEQLRTQDAEVLALSNQAVLFDEGCRMRHCVYNYLQACQDDQIRLFSARMRHRGRTERATIGLTRKSRGWHILDIRGTCNRRVGGHWIPLARQLAETYTHEDGSGQLPLPVNWSFDEAQPLALAS